tara:strand:- start:469 stop:726 length:258 start_codon:yes stop_codon:yes gene_type:complete
MIAGEFIILLMFFGDPMGLKEFTVRDGLGECMKAKRTIERNIRGGRSKEHKSSLILSCRKMEVVVDEDYRILEFVNTETNKIRVR